jgi:hypothetical protein
MKNNRANTVYFSGKRHMTYLEKLENDMHSEATIQEAARQREHDRVMALAGTIKVIRRAK